MGGNGEKEISGAAMHRSGATDTGCTACCTRAEPGPALALALDVALVVAPLADGYAMHVRA